MKPVDDFVSYNGDQGYVYDEAAIQAFLDKGGGQIMQSAVTQALAGSGKGKDFFIFEIERELTGKVRDPHNQTIGDCVSQGVTGAGEDLQFVIMKRKGVYTFKRLSSEVTYGLARIQIGQGGCGYGDGAVVAWGLEGAMKFGFLARGVYGDIDLTNYRADLAKLWGTPRHGCPDNLAKLAGENKVNEAHLIERSTGGPRMAEMARDVIASGGLIVTGSNQLFGSRRDAQGFCGRGGRGGHCTYYRGFTDNAKRPGIVYQQSWGPGMPYGGAQEVTLESGKVITLPPGAFFIDYDEFDRMHTGGGNEVWGLTSEVGYLAPDDLVEYHSYSNTVAA